MANVNQLKTEALALSVSLSDKELEDFARFTELLLVWNEKFNLTAITQPDQIATKHFVDSLCLWRRMERGRPMKVMDVGTGAGFPGLPLAITSPCLSVTLLDSVGKRFLFIEELIKLLPLANAACLKSRAEEAGRNPLYREQYDAAVSRAVAPMRILAEYCLPFVKTGGFFYALKGPDAERETILAEDMIRVLGGCLEAPEIFTLSDGSRRCLVIVKKIKRTPKEYPRRYDIIKRK